MMIIYLKWKKINYIFFEFKNSLKTFEYEKKLIDEGKKGIKNL